MSEINYEEIEKMSLHQLATRMQELRIILDEASAKKTTIQKEYDHIRLNAIPPMMDDQDISTVTFDDVGRVTLTSDIYATIPGEQKEAAWEWLRNNDHGDMIRETINAGTLKAALKSIIKKGEQLPEMLFKVTPFSRASITKISK